MTSRFSQRMTFARKLMLATAGAAAVAAPFLIGILNAPWIHAQSQESKLVFEVASIKPSSPNAEGGFFRMLPGEGLSIGSGSVRKFVTFAYDVQDFQVSGGPAWLNSARFDILAKPAHPDGPADVRQMTEGQMRQAMERQRVRMRALLAERFHLAIHKDSKEFPVYLLVVGKGGSKLQDAKPGGTMHMRNTRGQIEAVASPIELLTRSLSMVLDRTVLDRTGLTGKYDFKMEWTPDAAPAAPAPPGAPEATTAADPTGPSLVNALQEQLGLKLEAGRGPVEIIVIDRVEKPTEN